MKRRDFITASTALGAAGLGMGSILNTSAESVAAEGRPPEKLLQIYECQRCGTMVEVVHPGKPTLVHCSVPMNLLVEKTEDVGREKHVPIIEKTDDGYKVRVGSVSHPMTESHYITAVQLITDQSVHTKALRPGDPPEATFCVSAEKVTARAHCNLHGLWKSTATPTSAGPR